MGGDTTSDFRRRSAPAAFALAVVLGVAALPLIGLERLYRVVLDFWVIFYNSPPFADAAGITRSLQCERLGFETYLVNDCSVTRFVYTPFWKLLTVLPVTVGWTDALAIGFIAVFFVALTRLPAAPTRGGAGLMAIAMIAPSTAMAIQYGNNEMLLFGLAVLGAGLLGSDWARRRWSYAVFLLMFLLKYFPIVVMATALRERPARLFALAAVSVAVALAFGVAAGDQLGLSFENIYTMSPFAYLFGLKNVTYFIELMGLVSRTGGSLLRVAIMLAMAAAAALLARDARLRALVDALPARHRDFLVVGALLVVTAYFATQNVTYRQIYMLMALPGLLCLRQAAEGGPRYLRALPILAVVLMFAFPLRLYARSIFVEGSPVFQIVSLWGFLLQEAGWAIQITALLTLLFAALRSAPLFAGPPFTARPLAGGAG